MEIAMCMAWQMSKSRYCSKGMYEPRRDVHFVGSKTVGSGVSAFAPLADSCFYSDSHLLHIHVKLMLLPSLLWFAQPSLGRLRNEDRCLLMHYLEPNFTEALCILIF